jgi:hypothetical protein
MLNMEPPGMFLDANSFLRSERGIELYPVGLRDSINIKRFDQLRIIVIFFEYIDYIHFLGDARSTRYASFYHKLFEFSDCFD